MSYLGNPSPAQIVAQPWPQAYPSHSPVASQYPAAYASVRAPQRRVGMMVGGAALLFVSVVVGGLFFWNLHTYLTIEDRLADLGPETEWVVEMVEAASLRRMTIFGSVSALFGIAGLVLGGLGLRKR